MPQESSNPPGSASDPARNRPTATNAGRRTLNVEIPEDLYWHVRKCATESRLPMKEYMARFCQEARPYSPEESESQIAPRPNGASGQGA